MHHSSSGSHGMTRIADYLVERLQAHGVDTLFGVPGDFILSFFQHLDQGPLNVVNTCDEQGAGFAADAYARIKGLGVVCITWGVGGLKIANTTAQAFAEESPVIVISGTPGANEIGERALLHHMVNGFDTQRRVFEHITVAQAVLDRAETACAEIDRIIDAALLHKRPVYLEIPRDMVNTEAPRPTRPIDDRAPSDPPTVAAAVDDALQLLRQAKRPVAMVGMQVARFGLIDRTLNIIDRTQLPTSVMPSDKSAVPEDHPRFVGVYAGLMSRPDVQEFVESADCVLLLGTLLSDTNLVGASDHSFAIDHRIQVERDRVRIGYRTYEHVRLEDFIDAFLARELPVFDHIAIPAKPNDCATWQTDADAPMTVKRLFARLGCFLSPDYTVVADPGDAMFGSLELPVDRDSFIANAFYASLGFAVPASIGLQLANPAKRPIVIVGDGSFQMTGVELATSLRYGLSPIVIILNNEGYTTERLMIDGKFKDVLPWRYTKLTELFDGGQGFVVRTESELDAALEGAAASNTLCIIEVALDQMDASDALIRLTNQLRASMGVESPLVN